MAARVYLTAPVAAGLLGVTSQNVNQLLDRGTLAGAKQGHPGNTSSGNLIDLDSVNRRLASQNKPTVDVADVEDHWLLDLEDAERRELEQRLQLANNAIQVHLTEISQVRAEKSQVQDELAQARAEIAELRAALLEARARGAADAIAMLLTKSEP